MKKIVLLFVLTMSVALNSFAQKKITIKYTDEKIQALAKEVYNNETQYLTEEHLKIYKSYLNRIEIAEATEEQLKNGNYPLISTLVLKNKYNNDLDYDKGPNFDAQSFNGLKYFFVSDNKTATTYYRIYGTPYVVRLMP